MQFELAPRPLDRERHSLQQLTLIRQLHAGRGLSLSDAMFLATQMVHHGFFEARPVLQTLLREVPHAAARNYFAKLMARHEAIQALPGLGRVLADAPRMQALYDPAAGSHFLPGTTHPDWAIVVFTTVNNNFGISNAVLDAMLEPLGAARLYLKNVSRLIYFNGVQGLAESLSALPEALSALLGERGVRNVLVTGFSSGGYPALYTAVTMEAAACLIFSGYTDFSTGSALPQPRMFTNIASEIDSSQRVNMRDAIARSNAGPIEVYFGLDHPIDRAHAQHLSGLPRVRLVGLDDCGHYATTTLVDLGKLANCFAAAMGAAGRSAPARGTCP